MRASLLAVAAALCAATGASASAVPMPASMARRAGRVGARAITSRVLPKSYVSAMAIPGHSLGEAIFIDGGYNFLNIYNGIITFRILLSWVPQAQGVALLQPVFAITDPYLNLFRGVLPTFGGLDFSPLLAFGLLSVVTNAAATLGAPLPAKREAFMQRARSVMAERERRGLAPSESL